MHPLKVFLFTLFSVLGSAQGQSVLVLGDGGTEDSVLSILSANSVAAVPGGHYDDYTGERIGQHRAILLLNGVDYDRDIADSVQTRIRDFVDNGGSLMTTEWLAYYAGDYAILSELLPVTRGGGYGSRSETYHKAAVHPIADQLPDSFSTPPDWSFGATHRDTSASKGALTVFTGSESGDAVVLGAFGSGAVVHWNMGGHYSGPGIWSAETRRLLLNIVRYFLDRPAVETALCPAPGVRLAQNRPNPFNPATELRYTLARDGRVRLCVFDARGRRVAVLADGPVKAGTHSVKFHADGLAPGVYPCELRTGEGRSSVRMLLVK